jgi:hypothetical protein
VHLLEVKLLHFAMRRLHSSLSAGHQKLSLAQSVVQLSWLDDLLSLYHPVDLLGRDLYHGHSDSLDSTLRQPLEEAPGSRELFVLSVSCSEGGHPVQHLVRLYDDVCRHDVLYCWNLKKLKAQLPP